MEIKHASNNFGNVDRYETKFIVQKILISKIYFNF